MSERTPRPRSIVVLGAGAIGGLTGAALTRAGVDVTLIDPWTAHVGEIRRNGLHVTTPDEDYVVRVRIGHIDELPRAAPIDALALALKSYDTEWAVRYALPHMAPDGIVLSLQNGINEDRIATLAGAGRAIGCVVHLGGACMTPGRITSICGKGWPAFTLGELDGRPSERIGALAELLGAVGPTATTTDIWSALWSKLMLNVMSNALSGLSGYTTNRLWSDPACVLPMVRLGGETALVADAIGRRIADVKPTGATSTLRAEAIKAAHLGDASALAAVGDFLGAVAARRVGKSENQASLLQDIVKGRRAEVDYLNGHVVALGRRHGVPTPWNAAVVDAVNALELAGTGPGPAHLEALLARPPAA